MQLREFLAQDNAFSGEIPSGLYENSNLVELRLDGNQLSGTLSNQLGNLRILGDLRLSNNTFSGNIPFMFYGMSNLRKYRTPLIKIFWIHALTISKLFTEIVDLSYNDFSGSVRDAFGMFEKLDFLDLGHNSFTGVIPSSLFEIPTIRLVYLTNNRFESTIPANFGEAMNLRDLYLGSNSLQGTIPGISTGQLPNLNEFLLQNNDLTGEMPASICALRTPLGNLEDLWADCAPVNGRAEVECACCTQCGNFPANI